MLVRNPITPQLYNHGYNGIDNIYDYWMAYREEIIEIIKKKKRIQLPTDLDAFEYKIRWATFYGLWFRFYIRMHLRTPRDVIEFNKIPIKFGTMTMVLPDYIDDISTLVDKSELVDLRGLSLISYNFKNTVIRDVDFSYGALDSSLFENVSFYNCRFTHTSFSGAKLIGCTFDQSCTFSHNDFTNMHLEAKFDCYVLKPEIRKPKGLDKIRIKLNRETKFLQYTKIVGESFYEKCTDPVYI